MKSRTTPRLVMLMAIIFMMSIIASTAYAQAPDIRVTVNGSYIEFDQPPIIQDGRTLAPVRMIFEALGAELEWNSAEYTATAVRGATTIVIKIGDTVFWKNGTPIALDVPAQILNGRTLVPLRAIAESFDLDVQWDGPNRTAIISDPSASAYQPIQPPIAEIPPDTNITQAAPTGPGSTTIMTSPGTGVRFTIVLNGSVATVTDEARDFEMNIFIMEGSKATSAVPGDPFPEATFTAQGNNLIAVYQGKTYTVAPGQTVTIDW